MLARRLKPLDNAPKDGLVLHEIYASIQGESTYAGLPCTFIRTTACHLRCHYCDTPHAFMEGRHYTTDEIRQEVQRLGPKLVELTGGEPLLQANVHPLMQQLADDGYTVLLETSGSLDISTTDPRVIKIVDFKTPSSGEDAANLWSNLEHLTSRDEVKLVLGNRDDYEWAKQTIPKIQRATILLGVVWGELDNQDLARWILEDRLPVRMQVQLHKYIWDPKARGV
jgi:7-carboxy-7-deazaguanine synthase